MASPQEILERAIGLQSIGRADQALPLYSHLLKSNPQHPEILHRMGTALHQTGRVDLAERMIAAAVERQPDFADYRHNHGIVLQALGRMDDAVAAFERALKSDPLRPDTLALLGGMLAAGDRRGEGMAMMRRALVVDPAADEAWSRYGNHLLAISELPAALRCRRLALSLAPANPERWVAFGLALLEIDQGERARDLLRAALVLAPSLSDACNHLAYLDLGRLRLVDARTGFGRALQLRPDLASALAGLSEAAFAAGDVEEAIAWMRRALETSPGETHFRFRLGVQLLAAGRMAEGWERYGWLRSKTTSVRRTGRIGLWDGKPDPALTLLIAADQGVGDELLHAACIADAARDVGRVVIECDQRIVALMRRSFPDAFVHAYHRVGDRNRPEHLYEWVPDDCWPLRYADGGVLLSTYRGTVEQADAAARPWMVADPKRVAEMRQRLDALGPGPKVGVAWRSRRLTTFRMPHYPRLPPFEKVFSVPGVRFVSLQYGTGWEQELSETGVPVTVIDGLDTTNDFDGVFALVEALDLVICPSSTVGWIGASLGKPVWLLYNTPVFLEYGTDHYPGFPTVRGFRKTQVEPWRPLLDQVASALRDEVAQL